MRGRRAGALLILCALLLVGCTPMLERSYADQSPHIQFSDEAENAEILRAETYQGLVSALLFLVGQGEQAGTIRLYQYSSVSGAAASDVDRACLEVTQEDPLGAYAVDYIKYDVSQTPAYYEISVKLAYRKSPEEIAQVISVTGSSAVARELRELLPEQPERVAFRISYFTRSDSAEALRQSVQEEYDLQRESLALPELTDLQVALYPDRGQQRVAELTFTWAREEPPPEEGGESLPEAGGKPALE